MLRLNAIRNSQSDPSIYVETGVGPNAVRRYTLKGLCFRKPLNAVEPTAALRAV